MAMRIVATAVPFAIIKPNARSVSGLSMMAVSVRSSYVVVFGKVHFDIDPADGAVLVGHQPLVDTVLVE